MGHNDEYITKDDVFGYLQDRSPESFDDPELKHCYRMVEEYLDRHLGQLIKKMILKWQSTG